MSKRATLPFFVFVCIVFALRMPIQKRQIQSMRPQTRKRCLLTHH